MAAEISLGGAAFSKYRSAPASTQVSSASPAGMADSTTSGTSEYMPLMSLTAVAPLTPGSNKSSTNSSGSPFLMIAACNSLSFSSSTTLDEGRRRRNSMPMACRTKG
jgi:hypothetical protein